MTYVSWPLYKNFKTTIQLYPAEVLLLVLDKDKKSWSKDFRSTDRNTYDFLDLLVSTKLNLTDTSLTVLTSSHKHPIFDYHKRHNLVVQYERRATLARLRDYLMPHSLRDKEHLLRINSDVVKFSANIIQTMIGYAQWQEDAGIIPALYKQNRWDNYNKNT
ncbi:hypothetical protein Dda_9153 [Drechslerella dactyloides]|uniref:Uncharacterized protein n=1 Tax=Drechslerella dactyloides TaxID=74499 RepID=A0AAD6NEL3_DREDA|nr:hypothetical protein Dda_9153 [Drechslerella dactyloides]